jgi:hypothetical protein
MLVTRTGFRMEGQRTEGGQDDAYHPKDAMDASVGGMAAQVGAIGCTNGWTSGEELKVRLHISA